MKTFTLSGTGLGPTPDIDFAKELNAEQYAVVRDGDGYVLVLAGAGSGKTRTLVYRVAYLLAHGVRPDEILLLTFTNKAAREMLDRVGLLIKQDTATLWGGTFHHICHRFVRMYHEALGLPKNFTILDEEDAKDLVKHIIKESGVETVARRFPSAAVTKGVLSYAKNAALPIGRVVEDRYPQFFELSDDLRRIGVAYEARKKAAGVVDFDDLLLFARDLLQKPDIRTAIASRFRYVLVDEFQDTNALQSELVGALASVHQNLLVVGDDAQSIYSFRAADIQNILAFPKKFPNVKTFRLETNYRSTPEILDLANESITKNERQFEKTLKSLRSTGEKPNVVPTSSAREEAAFVAEMVMKVHRDGVPLSECCVLFRATHHSQMLEFELMRRGIPYEYRGGMRFFERAHIKDVLSFLRVLANHRDEPAWLRVLLYGRGIGERAAEQAFAAARGTSGLSEALAMVGTALSARARLGWMELQKIFTGMLTASAASAATPGALGDLVRSVLESGYQDILVAEYPNPDERVGDIEQLAVFAERYASLEEFLAEVSLFDGISASRGVAADTGEDRLVLSTIHQAKGLEWHTVFVIHLADHYFPNRRALEEREGIEEERRLFYVAVTRARQNLFLSYPVVMGEEHPEFVSPSMFIDELPVHTFERLELRYNGKKTSRPSSWEHDGEWEDEVVELDAMGDRKPKPFVERKTPPPVPGKKNNFLKGIRL